MREGRIVLCAFGVSALLLIGLPIGMLATARVNVPAEEAAKAEISQFFLAAQKAARPGETRQVLPEIAKIVPSGMADRVVFQKFAAAGFTCVPDAGSATCFRRIADASGCASDWRVSITFDRDGAVRTSEADRRTSCS